MSTAELIQEIKRLSNPDRLKIIEAATALIREELVVETARHREDVASRMRAAAIQAQALYEPGGELTEWTDLDGEEVLDDSVADHAGHTIQG
jgi:hypothetical protein